MPLLMEERTWSVGFSCVHESDCRRSSSLAQVDANRSDWRSEVKKWDDRG